jgi:hypothetical protein
MYELKLEGEYGAEITFSAGTQQHLLETLPILMEQLRMNSFHSIKIKVNN